MKAVVYTKYGPPEVLQLKEIPTPTPRDDEVLVKIHAAAANPLDLHFMRASPFIIRFISGFLKPNSNYRSLGADIAGEVELVGTNVKQFEAGDEVYGEISRGGFAEYVCVTEDKLVLKPASLSFEQAAAVPVAGLTALQCLRDQGKIQPEQKPGKKVLINGASGGVGTFAVQIARSFGAVVTGVCSAQNVDRVRSIGADQVIDYTCEDFTQTGQHYDLIFDNVGNRSISEIKRILEPNGTYLLNAYVPALMLQLMLQSGKSKTGRQTMRSTDITSTNQSDLKFLNALLEIGKVVPVIDKVYPLSEVPDAIAYLETGHVRGKVVIAV